MIFTDNQELNGEIMAQLLDSIGVSILYVSEQSGVRYPNLYYLLKGKRDVQLTTLVRILKAMGYSLAAIRTPEPDDPEPITIEELLI